MPQKFEYDAKTGKSPLNELGRKIYLDRYAMKDTKKATLKEKDLVIVCTDHATGQRELGHIVSTEKGGVNVELLGGGCKLFPMEHIDKPIEANPMVAMDRVARGIAQAETEDHKQQEWEQKFRWLLDDWKFIPGGRILAAAGSGQELSYYNCYVLPSPKDSRQGIIETLAEMMEIMSRGGGVGITLSTLRPRHNYVKGVNGRSSGSTSWGGLYSFVTGLVEQGGSRRGALILILDVWHPDIVEFINSKRESGKITNANISVGVSDAFMQAVKMDADWHLVFPDTAHPSYEEEWTGDIKAWQKAGHPVVVHKTMPARELWSQITDSAWASAEPGLWFNDRANKMSNSHYFAPLVSCNPCAEEPLPGYGVCNLGSLNLPRYLTEEGQVDWDQLKQAVHYAIRFLDNVIDENPYFFDKNEIQQTGERRVGLGSMGLGEMLIRMRLRYGSPASLEFMDELYRFIAVESYKASSQIAQEKGSFAQFEADAFLDSGFMKGMPEEIHSLIREQGIRNVTLLTQPPTGTTGTMVGTSTGIEPFFHWEYERKSRLGVLTERVGVYQEWLKENDPKTTPLPDYFVTAMSLSPEKHVQVLATIQRWVDAAISKTCNLPSDYTKEQVRELYDLMYDLGCKGGTIYRDQSRSEQVLNLKEEVVDVTEKEIPVVFVRPRPDKRFGVTISKQTPTGTAHITMNDDEEGNPLEVFVEIGKAGSDIKAMAEALGRMMSLVLRLHSHLPPREKVDKIISQIKGIGGGQSIGFGKNRVLSLPDAVGQALEEHYFCEEVSDSERGKFADLCPSCGQSSYVRTGSCSSCFSCGYSKC